MSSKSPSNGGEEPDGNDNVRMTISLDDSAAAQEVLHCLGSTSSEVSFSVDCIASDGDHPCVVSIDYISDRQLEVARHAVAEGYYDKPREASLTDLSDNLGISPSAISQHLNAVEHRLIKALVEACG